MPPKKKKTTPKKKSVKKELTWEEIEKQQFSEDDMDLAWPKDQDQGIVDYLRVLCSHMVWSGLEFAGQPEEIRMNILDEIMETKRYQLSNEEMLDYLPDEVVREQLYLKAKEVENNIYTLPEFDFHIMCNKLAELAVYRMMQNLEKMGYLTLAWDANKNDFVYKPGPKSNEGDDWKKNN